MCRKLNLFCIYRQYSPKTNNYVPGVGVKSDWLRRDILKIFDFVGVAGAGVVTWQLY